MLEAGTFDTAMSTAETDHLWLTMLHADSVMQAILCLFEHFRPEKHEIARRKLSESIRCVIVQKVHPSLEEDSRVPVQEIMAAESVVRRTIKEGKSDKIQVLLDVSSETGSRSFNKEMFRLLK